MLLTGQTLHNRYRILGPLGQGGMGAVYLAEDLSLVRRCAIKENVPDPNARPQALAQMRRQFQAEASILANLDHPNLPKVHDVFSFGSNEYIVMEYVDGEDLHSLQQRRGGPLPEKDVLVWADQILDALAYLHSQQPHPIIHRDIKPANIILTPHGKVILVDFGLVKLLDLTDPRTATVMKGMGTPEYAPLEQYAGGAGHTDVRSDIYSLGATLYHLLTGVPPVDVHQRILDPNQLVQPRRLNPLLSPYVEAAIERAIEIQPRQRFQAAQVMRQALVSNGQLSPAQVLHTASGSGWRKKMIWTVAVIVALSLFAFLIVQGLSPQPASVPAFVAEITTPSPTFESLPNPAAATQVAVINMTTRTPDTHLFTVTPVPSATSTLEVPPTGTTLPLSLTPQVVRLVINNPTLNVRGGPGTNYEIVGRASGGERFVVTGKNSQGTWYQINFDDQDRWVDADYVWLEGNPGSVQVASNNPAAPAAPTRSPAQPPQPPPTQSSIPYEMIGFHLRSINEGTQDCSGGDHNINV